VSWILDAGGIAGNAKDRQPWRFLVLGDHGLVEEVRRPYAHLPTCSAAALLIAVVVSSKGPVAFDPGASGLERDAGRLERGGRLLFEWAREPGQPGRAVRTRGG
jgi:hypothetical protein